MYKCMVDGPENWYDECDFDSGVEIGCVEITSGRVTKRNLCPYWKLVESSGSKKINTVISSCYKCPHLVNDGRESAWCLCTSKHLDVPMNMIPLWCPLEDR